MRNTAISSPDMCCTAVLYVCKFGQSIFYPILCYPNLSYSILSYPILSYAILFYPILSYPIPSHPVPSHPIPSHPIPFHSIPFYSVGFSIMNTAMLHLQCFLMELVHYCMLSPASKHNFRHSKASDPIHQQHLILNIYRMCIII